MNQQPAELQAACGHPSSSTRKASGGFWKIAKIKGATPGALHHLILRTAIPALGWGSEAWWTGADHLLREAGLLHLPLTLNRASQ